MAKVSIARTDRLPESCVLCGKPRSQIVLLRFGKRSESSFSGVLFVPRILRLLRAIVPTVGWPLPFCTQHSFRARLKRRAQPFAIALTACCLAVGVWSFTATNLTWPLVCSMLLAPLLLFGAHHLELDPLYVSKHRLELGAADASFVEEFRQLNALAIEAWAQDENPFAFLGDEGQKSA